MTVKTEKLEQKITGAKPDISVIIPAYNDEKYIKECLDSVLAQTFQNWEVICIDDGSTDKSLSIFQEYASRDPRIKVISQRNQGVIAARNNAISQANGNYIFPLDSDDKIAPTCLEVLYNFIKANPEYSVVCPNLILFGKEKGNLYLPKPTYKNMYSGSNGIHNSSLYPKSLWEKYGGYNPAFAMGNEDFDFWLKFMDDDKKVIRIPERLFYYRIKPDHLSRNKQAFLKDKEKELCELFHKFHPRMIKQKKKNKNIFRKILRFFVRTGVTRTGVFKIKIFKFIPFYWRNLK
jgi:glycosyltransferase involved in cell wall biosynthesis